MAEKKLSPWDIADNVFMKKERIDPVADGYDIWMMNKICSNNIDTIYFAEIVNMYPNISKIMSYDFYYYGLDKGRRYGKWRKNLKDEDIEIVCKAFKVNKLKAVEYLKVIGESGLKKVKDSQFIGGLKSKKKGA